MIPVFPVLLPAHQCSMGISRESSELCSISSFVSQEETVLREVNEPKFILLLPSCWTFGSSSSLKLHILSPQLFTLCKQLCFEVFCFVLFFRFFFFFIYLLSFIFLNIKQARTGLLSHILTLFIDNFLKDENIVAAHEYMIILSQFLKQRMLLGHRNYA